MIKLTPFSVWWFFPITGLEISDPNFFQFLDDATLVSKNFMADCLQIYSENYFPRDFAEKLLLNEKVDSLVAIKQRSLNSFTEEVKEAEGRFEEILAALVLYSLVEHNYTSAYCATDSLTVNHFGAVALRDDAPYGKVRSEIRGKVVHHRQNDILTVKELDHKLGKSEVSDIIGVILFPNLVKHRPWRGLSNHPLVHKSVRRSVVLAAKRLTAALNTHSSSEIVTACITCFEILLSTDGVKDDDVRGRLDVLVGFGKDQIDELYKARNEWIHRGIPCSSEIERRALVHIIYTMKLLLDLVFRLPENVTHGEILQWLDYHAFIRKRNNERPGRLEELVHRLEMFDPFQIAETVRLSVLSEDGGLMRMDKRKKMPKKLRRRMCKEQT